MAIPEIIPPLQEHSPFPLTQDEVVLFEVQRVDQAPTWMEERSTNRRSRETLGLMKRGYMMALRDNEVASFASISRATLYTRKEKCPALVDKIAEWKAQFCIQRRMEIMSAMVGGENPMLSYKMLASMDDRLGGRRGGGGGSRGSKSVQVIDATVMDDVDRRALRMLTQNQSQKDIDHKSFIISRALGHLQATETETTQNNETSNTTELPTESEKKQEESEKKPQQKKGKPDKNTTKKGTSQTSPTGTPSSPKSRLTKPLD